MNDTPLTKTLQRITEADVHYTEFIDPYLQKDGWTGTYDLHRDNKLTNLETYDGWGWNDLSKMPGGHTLAIKIGDKGWGKWLDRENVKSPNDYIDRVETNGTKVYEWQIINDSWAINALERLGLEEVTSKRQEKSGTLMFKDPHMVNYETYYTFHIRTGYVRRMIHGPNPWGGGKRWTCYQLAGTKREKIYNNFPKMVHKTLRSIEGYQQNNWDTLNV